jgi:signal transduction histidine kinase
MTNQEVVVRPQAYGIAAVVYLCYVVATTLDWPAWIPLTVATAGAGACLVTETSYAIIGPCVLSSMFLFSLRTERTAALMSAVTVAAVLLISVAVFDGETHFKVLTLPAVPWVALAAAIGQAARSKRAHHMLLEERLRRAEESRETEARRRVQEERLRIARELHDAVGHHVAVINVQAGAMSYLLGEDSGKAMESLGHIQRASESALEELRLAVGLLRQPDDAEPLEPAGGLARLGSLTDVLGVEVNCEVTGEPRPLPEAVDLTAFRVIQESLTNVTKHAPGSSATVSLSYRDGWLGVAVTNDGPPVMADGEGHGIAGMRERAATVGGLLTAGPRAEGGFQVLAELPAGTP